MLTHILVLLGCLVFSLLLTVWVMNLGRWSMIINMCKDNRSERSSKKDAPNA